MCGHSLSGPPFLIFWVLSALTLLRAGAPLYSEAREVDPPVDAESPEGLEPATSSEVAAEPDEGAAAALAPTVLLAAGDIASCDSPGDRATAALLDGLPGTIAALGDTAYDAGTAAEFARCYEPSWGRHKGRTRPAPGNHEYETPGASAYFAYFGAAAGDAGKGYYSYDLGGWHLVALNSNCAQAGGCQAGSPQESWLRADLAAHPTACALAYWHHPRFSSGPHGGDGALEPLWQALYEAGAEVVLVGHDHLYERFAPQDPRGGADPARGIRQFTVGTGGRSHYSVVRATANSEVANDNTFGVLKLTLRPTDYDWQFIPVAGGSFNDSGTSPCHY